MKILKISLIILAAVFTVLIVSCQGKETIIIKEKVDDKVVKPDPVKPDPVKPDPVKPDPVKPDPVKPDPVKPDPIVEPVYKGNINDLKMVKFKEKTRKIINSRNGTFGDNPKNLKDAVYVKVREPLYVNPLKIPMNSNNDIIFPGSLLRGKDFMKGRYKSISQPNELEDVRVSLSLRGKGFISKDIKPKPIYMRSFIKDVIGNRKDDLRYVAGTYQFESSEITTMESFKKTMCTHITADTRSRILSEIFNYDKQVYKKRYEKTNFYLISFTQKFFNASIDSKHHTKWFSGGLNCRELIYEPLYISSVDYGRAGYILVESNESSSEVKKMLDYTITAKVGRWSKAKLEKGYAKQVDKGFNNNKIKIFFNGGDNQHQGRVKNIDTFMEYLQNPGVQELVDNAKPISFKVRRVRDNTEVQVYDSYTYIKKIMKN